MILDDQNTGQVNPLLMLKKLHSNVSLSVKFVVQRHETRRSRGAVAL